MDLFDKKGHLTDEALAAVCDGSLDELNRLEAAEHLAYCDRCLERYTALLTEDALLTPQASCRESLWKRIRRRTLHVLGSRYAVAAAAVALAFTLMGTGVFTGLVERPLALQKMMQTRTSVSQVAEKPTQDAPQRSLFSQINNALDSAVGFLSGRTASHSNGGK